MSFSIRYRPPDADNAFVLEDVDEVVIGRNPGDDGLTLTPYDDTISAAAVNVCQVEDGLRVENTSSFATIELRLASGTIWMSPKEAMVSSEIVGILVSGSVWVHTVELYDQEQSVNRQAVAGTRPVLETAYEIPEERFPALVALCAPHFYQDRFGQGLLDSRSIAKRVSPDELGKVVTPKAVDNKLQRIRSDLAEKHGLYLDSREDLAGWAVRERVVTRFDVDRLFGL